jgi:hypothetical protein
MRLMAQLGGLIHAKALPLGCLSCFLMSFNSHRKVDAALSHAEAKHQMGDERFIGAVRFDTPIHSVTREYASLIRELGPHGTLCQAVEFFRLNAVRPELQQPAVNPPSYRCCLAAGFAKRLQPTVASVSWRSHCC